MAHPRHSHHRLEIAGVISTAADLAQRVRLELPTHDGLARCSATIEAAARNAERVSRGLNKPVSLHRLPVLFVTAALMALAFWTYETFFHTATLSLALPKSDAAELKDVLKSDPRLAISVVEVPGSREAAQLVSAGQVDLAFIQGGIPLAPGLARAELKGRELVLLFLRPGVPSLAEARVVLTSTEGEGSHAVLLDLLRILQVSSVPKVRHEWPSLAQSEVAVDPSIDAVLVVKDPSDEKTTQTVAKLSAAGFELSDLVLGASGLRLPYLERATIEPSWLSVTPRVPARPVSSWSVATYLVARDGLTPRSLAQAYRLAQPARQLSEMAVMPSTSTTSEVVQGIDAFFSILINIALGFLALLGLNVWSFRKQFHELNSLVSVLGQLQSNKDVLAVKDTSLRRENMQYLSIVSDLLNVVSHISNYYTQEHSALVFNSLSDVVHERCSALKLNIQLKLLQAAIRE